MLINTSTLDSLASSHLKSLNPSSPSPRAMENQGNNGRKFIYAELDSGETTIDCPTCHATIRPTIGNLIASRFECPTCKASLSYMDIPGRTVRCPCCKFARPIPDTLVGLVCGRCNVTIVYQKGDQAVKCTLCNHITSPPQAAYGYRVYNGGLIPCPVDAPQVNQVLNRMVPPRGNQVVPPPQGNQVVPTQVNQEVPSQVNRVVPPRATRGPSNPTRDPRILSRFRDIVNQTYTDDQLRRMRDRALAVNILTQTMMNFARTFQAMNMPTPKEEDQTEEGKGKKRPRDE